jgi:hypothetical protein
MERAGKMKWGGGNWKKRETKGKEKAGIEKVEKNKKQELNKLGKTG